MAQLATELREKPRQNLENAHGENARRRNTPSIINSAYQDSFGWAGETHSLEEQAASTFQVSGDMGMSVRAAIRRLNASQEYRKLFQGVFGRRPGEQDLVNAIASFERREADVRSRFDRFFFDHDSLALTDGERRGWGLFTQLGCAGCHDVLTRRSLNAQVAAFSDNKPHNLGVGYSMGVMSDRGRYDVTGDPRGWGAFLTPSLRGVSKTAPYMHDGSLASLADVVEFYARGGNPNPQIDIAVRVRGWSDEQKADLVRFLGAL